VISIKIQCGCGQRYAFDAEPIDGQMPAPVACPACGADGTAAANAAIAQSLASAVGPSSPAVPGGDEASSPPLPAGASPPPPAPRRPPGSATVTPQTGLAWYEHVWIALPIALVGVGGAIGGACGATAWAVNRAVFGKTSSPVLRYVWTGLVSAAAVAVYLVLAAGFISLVGGLGGARGSKPWQTFNSPEGKFRALFPDPPRQQVETALFLKVHSVTCEQRLSAYVVMYSDFPEALHVSPTDKFYDGSRNGALGKDGKLLQEKSFTIEGFPGREIQLTKKNGRVFIVDRYFLAGNRLYQIMSVVPSASRSSTNIAYFLDSFHLVKP